MKHEIPGSEGEIKDELHRVKVNDTVDTLCEGLNKIDTRFVQEAIYGITSSGSVRLSAIAGALAESIPLHATHKRLSRNLGHERIGGILSENLLQLSRSLIGSGSILVLASADLEKRYAQSMAFLGEIEGSERRGYQMCEITAAGDLNTDWLSEEYPAPDLVPIAQTFWSTSEPGYEDDAQNILGLASKVFDATSYLGLLIASRKYDRRDLLVPWTENSEMRYVVRQRRDSELLYRSSSRTVRELVDQCTTPYGATVFLLQGNDETGLFIHCGFVPVRLPESPDRPLYLIVVKGLPGEDGALLTTEPMRKNRTVIQSVLERYFESFSVTQTSRMMKDDYPFSDVRVLTYDRLQNMAALLQVATYFDCFWPAGRATQKGLRFERRYGKRDTGEWFTI